MGLGWIGLICALELRARAAVDTENSLHSTFNPSCPPSRIAAMWVMIVPHGRYINLKPHASNTPSTIEPEDLEPYT